MADTQKIGGEWVSQKTGETEKAQVSIHGPAILSLA
jgi:hypothetical protein